MREIEVKLVRVTLENFRGYKEPSSISIDALTTLIGKNDAGKSTFLEALDMFFNDGRPDSGDACVYSESKKVRVCCVFDDLPPQIILDSSSITSLSDEYLLNEEGELEIIKEWDVSFKTPKESIFILANHPSSAGVSDLLFLKNADLKSRLGVLGIDASSVDVRVNAEIRKVIRQNSLPLKLKQRKIPVDREGGKEIWEKIRSFLPMYALFKSDRPSHDGDDEIQSPLKLAVAQALKELEPELKAIEEKVRVKAEDVANRTLQKLKEMDDKLANELKPLFRTDPKWDVFKLGLVGDNGISVNKRGSGVRRLILLNFFRAEAERRRKEKGGIVHVIYAIEEPETSQHPHNQRLLLEAIHDLTSDDHVQVMLTSHTPNLAGLLPISSLRYVKKEDDGTVSVAPCKDQDLPVIANELGIIPDKRVQVIMCVEGSNDVEFFFRISSILRRSYPDVVDLSLDRRVALLPVGGGALVHWVNNHYLKGFGLPEIHIYDRDDESPPKYQECCDEVNSRGDGSWAVITSKREIDVTFLNLIKK